MNWKDELTKIYYESEADKRVSNIKVFIESLLKEQVEIDKKIAHKIADDCYNRIMINHREVDKLFEDAPEPMVK